MSDSLIVSFFHQLPAAAPFAGQGLLARFAADCGPVRLKVHSEGLAQPGRRAKDDLSAMRPHLPPCKPKGGDIPPATCFRGESTDLPRVRFRTACAQTPPGKR